MSTKRIAWSAALLAALAATMVIWIVVERRSEPWTTGEVYDPLPLGYSSEGEESGDR